MKLFVKVYGPKGNRPVWMLHELTGVSYDTGRVLYRASDKWFDGEDVVLINGPV